MRRGKKGVLYDLGRYDEVVAVRKLASQVEAAERKRGEQELEAKMQHLQDSLRARHQREKQIVVGQSVMSAKTLAMEIDAGREWISNMTKIQGDNVLQRHRHAALIKEGRCPDVGYERMVSVGRRYHKEYVSEDSHPIPSVSLEHKFVEPSKKEVADQRMATTRQRAAAMVANSTFDIGKTVEVGILDEGTI